MGNSNHYPLNETMFRQIEGILAAEGVSPIPAQQPSLQDQSLEVRAVTTLSNGECFVLLFLPAERASLKIIRDTREINDLVIQTPKSLQELAEMYEVFLQEDGIIYHRDPQHSMPELLRGAATVTYRLVRRMEDKDGQRVRAQAIEALCYLAQFNTKGQP